jgi:hypothetical protein
MLVPEFNVKNYSDDFQLLAIAKGLQSPVWRRLTGRAEVHQEYAQRHRHTC